MRCLPVIVCALSLDGCSILAPSAQPLHVVRGPVAVKTEGPIVANFLQFRPRSAATTAVGRVRVDCRAAYASMFENGTDGTSDVVLDGEIVRTGFALRTGVSSSADIEVEIPFVYASSGFLDALIGRWHDAFGFPNGGREERPSNDYEMHVDQDGNRIYQLERDTLALGDIPIVLTQAILEEVAFGFGLSARAGLEFPTGSQSRGFGNGGIDWGGGLIVESSVDRFTLTGGAYYVVTSTPDAFRSADVECIDQVYAHTGLECRWNDRLSLLSGVRFSTPATRDIAIPEVDGEVLDLDLALALDDDADIWRLTLGLTEDLIAESGPDLTFFAAWTIAF